jgi:hypothetical protein
MSAIAARATVADLAKVEGKAELIDGRIDLLKPTGRRPHRMAFRITRSLDDHAQRINIGEAYADNMGFTVPELSSGRGSFSPDASYYAGPFPADEMRFIEGPPTMAAEVRSENDYGPPPNKRWRTSEPIISRLVRSSFGMSIRWRKWCVSIVPRHRIRQWCTAAATSPKPSRRCRDGAWRWMRYSADGSPRCGRVSGPGHLARPQVSHDFWRPSVNASGRVRRPGHSAVEDAASSHEPPARRWQSPTLIIPN